MAASPDAAGMGGSSGSRTRRKGLMQPPLGANGAAPSRGMDGGVCVCTRRGFCLSD